MDDEPIDQQWDEDFKFVDDHFFIYFFHSW